MTTNNEQLAEAYDGLISILLDITRSRTPLINEDGKACIDAEGKPYMTLPSAAHLRVVRDMLKDLNFKPAMLGDEDKGDGTPTSELEKEAKKRGLTFQGRQLPAIDEETPDAATG